MQADPAVVLRILEDGSWAETDWIQHYWAGVLATSCGAAEALAVRFEVRPSAKSDDHHPGPYLFWLLQFSRPSRSTEMVG